MSPISVSSTLQNAYDSVLQETFTTAENPNGRVSPQNRFLPASFLDSMERPPHITLFWVQSINGIIKPTNDIKDNSLPGVSGLIPLLEKSHEASISNLTEAKVEINPFHGQGGKNIEYQVEKGLPLLFLQLVRNLRVKSLLLKPRDNKELKEYLKSGLFDKLVIVIQPELNNSASIKETYDLNDLKIKNIHYEFLQDGVVLTGEPGIEKDNN